MRSNKMLLIQGPLLALALAACSSSSDSPPPPPAAPTNVTAVAKDGYVLVDASTASDATGANVYWATASGVTATNSTKVMVGSAPQAITGLSNSTTYYFKVSATGAGGESALSAEVSATPVAATVVADPLYVDQWHLKNTGQVGGTSGQDLNVEPAWNNTIPSVTNKKGEGVLVAVVDDGLEIGHEDLAGNMAANDKSYNYVTGTNDPTNSVADLTSGHGTAVAGIIASRDSNGLGGAGAAPRASLAGYNLLQNLTTSNEENAMTRNSATVSVSSNSWGAPDGRGLLEASTSTWKAAIDYGLANGRGGKGTVYLWAAGNGGTINTACTTGCDNSNYDGRANYHGVLAVAAVNYQGNKSSYSELGANLWISAPGGEYCATHTITTTDRTGSIGFNTSSTTTDYSDKAYTKCMNGTSSATPGVAGVVALMLAANPNLGWRDVRLILAQTARKNNSGDAGWITNGIYSFNHKYGFGVADAAAAVSAAATWTNVAAETTQLSGTVSPNALIPDATSVPGAPVASTITVPAGTVSSIEFVEITFSAADHTYAGDLEITLTSPNGKVSRLAEPHACLDSTKTQVAACSNPYNSWVFGSALHLGENPTGNWTLTVTDSGPGDTGHLQSWGMKFYGH